VKEQGACLQLDVPVYPIFQNTSPNRLYKPCAVPGYVSKNHRTLVGAYLIHDNDFLVMGPKFRRINGTNMVGVALWVISASLRIGFGCRGTYNNRNIGMSLMQMVFCMA